MYYRKLPVVIQAIMWDGTNLNELIDKLPGFKKSHYIDYIYGDLYIQTLEGDMKASVGDYIVRGVNGEFYPCKNDIFLKTYEMATDYKEEK